MPEVQRSEPMWKQIATHYKEMILRGELRQGDSFPSIRDIRDQWQVSQSTAQRAHEHLHLAERLIDAGPSGSRVARPRAAFGPQQRMRLTDPPSSEMVTVTAAGLVAAPDYIVPMFGLAGNGGTIVRREEVTRREDGTPGRLSVTWCSPSYLARVPELAMTRPLPDPKGAAHLIAARTDIDPGSLTGGIAFETRTAKVDGREMPALGLHESWAYVLAVVYGWRHGDDLLEYTEFILPPNQVVEADIFPA